MLKRSQETRSRVGKKIQKLRKVLNISQEDFAFKLGISRTHMGHIEQGRKSPSLELLDKIARALKVKMKDLFS